jgi:hypothetical protein
VVAHEGRAGARVIRIRIARAGPGVALDEHLVAALDQLVSRRGQQRHPVFLVFDFFRNADEHGDPSITPSGLSAPATG